MRASCLRSSFLIVLVVLTVQSSSVRADGVDDSRWAEIVAMRTAGASVIESFQVSFKATFREGPEETPEALARKAVRWETKGGSSYYHDEMEALNPVTGAYEKSVMTIASNGMLTGRRNKSLNVLSLSRKNDAAKKHSHTPSQIIEPEAPEWWDSRLKSGAATIISIATGDDLISVTFAAGPPTDRLTTEIAYDTKHGYLPVRLRRTDSSGRLVMTVEAVRFGEFEMDGNRLFYPLEGTKRIFDEDGKAISYANFSVSAEDIAFNKEIPNERFTLMALPNERVFDEDVKAYVVSSVNPDQIDTRLADAAKTRTASQTNELANAKLSPSVLFFRVVLVISAIVFIWSVLVLMNKRKRKQLSPISD